MKAGPDLDYSLLWSSLAKDILGLQNHQGITENTSFCLKEDDDFEK